jgi:Zn-finger nucleic acid-binding protein
MRCPNCKGILCRIDYEGIPVCTCPDCQGEFVDYSRLRRIGGKQEVQFEKTEAKRLKHIKTGPEIEKQRICPRCGNLMAKGIYRTTDVIIDYCKSCRGVWLDDQELEKIQVLDEHREASQREQSATAPVLASALTGARTIAKESKGVSTDGQGYATDASLTVSLPRLRVRVIIAAILIAVLLGWVTGLIHTFIPIERIFDEEYLDWADKYLPAVLIFSAAAFAFTFKKITIIPGRSLEVKHSVFGIPKTTQYPRKNLKCLATDFSQSFISGGGLWSTIFDIWMFGYLWAYWRVSSRSRDLAGTSYLYVVLKSGKRIRIYGGANDNLLGRLADLLQSGLGLEVRRL